MHFQGESTVAARPARAYLRPTRLAARLRRLVAGALCVALLLPVLAALDNALTPGLAFDHAAVGPLLPAIVRDIAVDSASGALYAATNSGVFKSYDGGDTWQPASRGLADVDVQNVVVDVQRGALYAAVFGLGVFVSDDGAATWRNASQGIQGRPLTTIALDPQTGILYAGTDGYGLSLSRDGGARWETAGGGLMNHFVARLVPGLRPGELFAATDRGAFHSVDAAVSWEQLAATAPPTPAWSFAIDPDSGVVYAATNQGVLRFEPQGARLRLAFTGLNQLRAQTVALDPRTGHLYAGAWNDGVWRSTDRGATWSPLNAGLRSTRIQTLRIDAASRRLLAGTDSGVFHLDAGGEAWQAAQATPVARHVISLAVDQVTGEVYAGTSGGGVFRSSDGGASWRAASIGLSNGLAQSIALDRGGGMIYVGTPDGVFRTPLTRIAWRPAGADLAGVDVASIVADERSGFLFAVTGRGDVFRSIDQGASWQLVDGLRQLFARTIAVSAYSGAIYVGAFRGGVARSLDQGFTWAPVGRNLPDPNIEALLVDERDGALYAGALGGSVFRTADGGMTWQRVGESLSARVLGLALDGQAGAVLAATSAGLFRFNAAAGAWLPDDEGLSHSYILALASHRDSGAVYAGTRGGGAFRRRSGESAWQPINAGLSDAAIGSLVSGGQAGALWAAVPGWGVFRTDDGGQSWRPANAGLPDFDVRSLARDAADGSLWAAARTGVFRLPDLSETWQPAAATVAQFAGLLFPLGGYGVVARPGGDGDTAGANEQFVWVSLGGGGAWAQMSAGMNLARAAVLPVAAGDAAQPRVASAWGAEIAQASTGDGYGRAPLGWMWLRAWVWGSAAWLRVNAPWWWVAVLAGAGLMLAAALISRLSLAIRFGAPVAVGVLRPRRMPAYARPRALDRAWPRWDASLKGQLYRYGDVKPVDLPRVPGPFRSYALRRYVETYGDEQPVGRQGDCVWLNSAERVQAWLRDWQALSRELKGQKFRWLKRERADRLAAILADALGVRLLPARDVESVRAYGVVREAAGAAALPALGLLFVSDSEPSAGTLRHLSVALRRVRETIAPSGADGAAEPIGIIIPLGRPGAQRDVAATLQRVLVQTELVARMVILDGDQALDVLAAREPAEALRRHIANATREPAAVS